EPGPDLCNALTRTSVVETMGLEPTTPCLQSVCSSQLSYVPGGGPAPWAGTISVPVRTRGRSSWCLAPAAGGCDPPGRRRRSWWVGPAASGGVTGGCVTRGRSMRHRFRRREGMDRPAGRRDRHGRRWGGAVDDVGLHTGLG